MSDPAILIRDVRYSYNGVPVLKSIDLTVEEDDFLAVIGPNGGGKTTLIKIMLGLYRPDSGSVRVLGRDPVTAARKVGYVPQDTTTNRMFPIIVRDVIRMGLLGRDMRKEVWGHEASIVRNALETVDMWEFRDRRIGELSGGQRQRVFISRALATEPDILMLDEPTANIDLEGQMKIYSVLKRLNERMTIVVASHDVTGLLGYARSMAYVNVTLHTHDVPHMTHDVLEQLTGTTFEHLCPVGVMSRMLDHR